MKDFAAVDSVIKSWVEATGSKLFTKWAGEPARFFHIPGKPPHECFQISIDRPSANEVTVFASAIDTNDDSESDLGKSWRGSLFELNAMLSEAVETVEAWKARPQAGQRKQS